MPEAQKAYYCLACQMPLGMRSIQAGGHKGHFLTEFKRETENHDVNSLLRMFREKMFAAKRRMNVMLKRDF